MKYPYKLTKANLIYFSIIGGVFLLFKLLTSRLDPESLGEITGGIVMFFIFPYFMGSIFWYALGRKEHGGTTTFNVILTLLVISQFNMILLESSKKRETFDNIKSSLDEYKSEAIEESDTSYQAYNKFRNSMEENIDDLIKQTTSSDEKKVLLVLKKFINSSDTINNKWLNSHHEISKESFFDFTILNDKEELENQIMIVNRYINISKEYKSFFNVRLINLENEIKNLEINNDFVKGVLKGIRKKDALQRPIFNPYIECHIKYGEKMKETLYLLRSNKWSPSEEEIVSFKNPNIQIEFKEIIDKLTELEYQVNDLQVKLIEVM